MADIRFTLPEIDKYFRYKPLNSFVPTDDKRGVIAVTLFKKPYHNSELNSQQSISIGMLHVLDLLCCEIPVGYAFVAPSVMRIEVKNFMLNVRSKAARGENACDPQLKFRGTNFSLYADKRTDDVAVIIDRHLLVDVSAAN